MLKQRIITGLILAPIFVALLLYFPTPWVAAVIGVIALAGAWEWSTMIYTRLASKISYVIGSGILMACGWYFLQYNDQRLLRLLLLVASCYWVFVLALLSFYRSSWLQHPMLHGFLSHSGYLVIATGWLAIIALHKQSPSLLLFLFVLIWVADSAAYFSGKRFGRVKLAAELSPGKTREGLWGAVLATFVVSMFGVWWLGLQPAVAVYFTILCVFTALISVVGDLFESLLKRNAGVKDSGFLIPGHGGVLDRIDSILAASPGFVLGLYWLK